MLSTSVVFVTYNKIIESHLRDKQFPSTVIQEYVKEIFGWRNGDTIYEGLVDCIDAQSFNSQLQQLHDIWDEREKLAFCDRKEYNLFTHGLLNISLKISAIILCEGYEKM